MATFVIKDAHVTLDGRNISSDVTSVTVNVDVLTTENSPFASEWVVFAPGGRRSWSMTIELLQDFDAGAIDSFLWPKLGELVTTAVRHKSPPKDGNNPSYEGTAILLSYPPFDNAVGEIARSLIVLQGSDELQRRTT